METKERVWIRHCNTDYIKTYDTKQQGLYMMCMYATNLVPRPFVQNICAHTNACVRVCAYIWKDLGTKLVRNRPT